MATRIVCRELVLEADGTVIETKLLTFDVDDPVLEEWLRGASATSRREVQGGELVTEGEPVPPEPIEPPVPADDCDVLRDVPAGVPVDEHVFGWTILHGGESYFTPNMTPEGGNTGGRMKFRWTRQFASWSKVEATRGVYTWGVVASKADYYAQRELLWSLVLTPVSPAFYGGPPKGPPPSEQPYRDYLLNAFRTFWPKGMRAVEICNEPETDNWYGSLGHKPLNDKERRQTARELSPWARVAHEAAQAYLDECGNKIEVWATSSQSMAGADPNAGLARVFNDPSAQADSSYGGKGFLNGSDGQGGTGAQWLDRFTFHGYPSPSYDPKLLHDHFLKAGKWCADAGIANIPMVVTEHGVLSDRNSSNSNRATGYFREWKCDNPYTGKLQPISANERCRWILNSYAVPAIHGGRMIFYAWDEQYMGVYGYANGNQGGSPTAPLGWAPNYVEIETKYKNLRDKLVGRKVFTLWKRKSDGLFIISAGTDKASELIYLE